jgi:hypothetical protein
LWDLQLGNITRIPKSHGFRKTTLWPIKLKESGEYAKTILEYPIFTWDLLHRVKNVIRFLIAIVDSTLYI